MPRHLPEVFVERFFIPIGRNEDATYILLASFVKFDEFGREGPAGRAPMLLLIIY